MSATLGYLQKFLHRDHAQQAGLDWQRDTKALNTNPFNVEVQYRITKAIRQQAIMENLEHVLDYRQVFGRVTAFQTGADQRCGRKASAHNESVPGGNATKRALWSLMQTHAVLFVRECTPLSPEHFAMQPHLCSIVHVPPTHCLRLVVQTPSSRNALLGSSSICSSRESGNGPHSASLSEANLGVVERAKD
ncbi:uncharacterized protein EDB91DRAFT_1275579 [Suillus paluster]|uniref:uncharacterized protein n=1 Tax=Suillus paluster TaxID=48578 RepID=UPI001B885F49|nr:uncharacterized protein EDB91DRAFT_1275579 [Suillus paluster]KAG1721594.1 hypothetical protein EDB91DRAFT_1275579 [Suillus paluster]